MSERDVISVGVKKATRIYNTEPEVAAQQSGKEECDINTIVERAKRGADISSVVSQRAAMYGDFTGLPDYRQALLMVNQARDLFMSLDAKVRERFANDPARLLDFVGDPKNRDEAITLGLVKAPEVPKVDEHLETLKSIDSGLKARSDAKSKKRSDGDEA